MQKKINHVIVLWFHADLNFDILSGIFLSETNAKDFIEKSILENPKLNNKFFTENVIIADANCNEPRC